MFVIAKLMTSPKQEDAMDQYSRRRMLGLMGGIAASGAIAGLVTPALAAAAKSKEAASYPETVKRLMHAVAGEIEANAKYRAFADVAEKEGQKEIAAIFRVIAEAELQHADHEFGIAQSLSKVERPKADKVTVGTTKENLQAAINGETEEYTKMYPEFINIAEKEHMVDARLIFILAKLAEEVHAGVYADLLSNLGKFDKNKYAKVYRCPECGNIILKNRPKYCPICAEPGEELREYKIVG